MNKKLRYSLLTIVGALLVITLTITYGYFDSIVGDGATTNVDIISDLPTSLEFIKGDDISLEINPKTLTEGGSNVTGTTTSTAKLYVAQTAPSVTENYHVYFEVTENTFEYTTADKKPEMILTVSGPNGDVTSLAGLKYVSSTDAVTGDTISGFDITTFTGVLRIKENEEITGLATETITEDWTITITFVNLTTDQSDNMSKKLTTDFMLKKEMVNGIALDTYDALVPVQVESDGSSTTSSSQSLSYADYENKIWANAVLTTDATRDEYLNAGAGTTVDNNDVQGYYVWIPRYKYYTNADGSTTVELESASTPKSTGSGANGEFLTHPAFTTESGEEIEGFWVSKYLLSTADNSTQYELGHKKMLYSLPGNNAYMYNDISYYDTYGTLFESEKTNFVDVANIALSSYNYPQTVATDLETQAVDVLANSPYGIDNSVATDVFPYITGTTTGITTNGNISGVYDYITLGSNSSSNKINNTKKGYNTIQITDTLPPIGYVTTFFDSNISGYASVFGSGTINLLYKELISGQFAGNSPYGSVLEHYIESSVINSSDSIFSEINMDKDTGKFELTPKISNNYYGGVVYSEDLIFYVKDTGTGLYSEDVIVTVEITSNNYKGARAVIK